MNKLKQVLKDVIRGTGTLPYVGEHLGLPLVIFCAVFALLSIVTNGFLASVTLILLGLLVATLVAFAYGSYMRALFSDALREEAEEEQRQKKEAHDGR